MTTDQDRLKNNRAENNDRLWNVLEAYKNDPEGVTKQEVIDLAEFRVEAGATFSDIFDRAIQVCKRRADSMGMIIPRATLVKGRGYAYVLTDQASMAVPGFVVQERVAYGTRRSAYKHQQFIEKDLGSLSPMERVIVEGFAELSDQQARDREDQRERNAAHLLKVREAYVKEMAQRKESLMSE